MKHSSLLLYIQSIVRLIHIWIEDVLTANEAGILKSLFPFISDQDRLLILLSHVGLLPLSLCMLDELPKIPWMNSIDNIHKPITAKLLALVPIVREIYR